MGTVHTKKSHCRSSHGKPLPPASFGSQEVRQRSFSPETLRSLDAASRCRKALSRGLQPILTLRLLAAVPSRRARSHLLSVQSDAAAPSRPGPGARPRSSGSAAPTERRGKLSPRQSALEDRVQTRLVAPFRGGGWGRAGVRFKLQDTHTPLPHRTRRRSPFLAARALSLSGCRPPELGPRPPPFRAAPGPSSAEPRRAEGAFVPPSRRTLRPGATPQPPAHVASSPAGSQEPAGTDPSRRGALTCRSSPTASPLALSSPPFSPSLGPRPSYSRPPAGYRPRRCGRLARPLFSCLTRRGASGVRRRRG